MLKIKNDIAEVQILEEIYVCKKTGIILFRSCSITKFTYTILGWDGVSKSKMK